MPFPLCCRRFSTFILLCSPLFCVNVAAQWTPVVVDDAVITYVDQIPTRRALMARMTWLADYNVVQVWREAGYFSRMEEREYDCRRKRSRALSVSLMSGAMGQGTAVFSDHRRHAWRVVSPGSFTETMWQLACHVN